MLLALLLACRCNSLDAPQEVSFPSPVLRQVGGRFREEPTTPIAPQVAFAVEKRCPRIDRVRMRHANPAIREITLAGSGLDQVTRIGATLADGTLADAQFIREGDGLVFPIACTDCEVYLGIPAGDRTAACMGPGYSIAVRRGRIVEP
jgi:hypothetical protein